MDMAQVRISALEEKTARFRHAHNFSAAGCLIVSRTATKTRHMIVPWGIRASGIAVQEATCPTSRSRWLG